MFLAHLIWLPVVWELFWVLLASGWGLVISSVLPVALFMGRCGNMVDGFVPDLCESLRIHVKFRTVLSTAF